jgi:hypothetical protein
VGVTSLLMNVGESTFYNQLLQASIWLWLGLGVATFGVSSRVIVFELSNPKDATG